LRMRRGLRDELGIKVEGAVAGTPQGGCPVLAGGKSLEERLAEDAVRVGRADGEFYSDLENYDPVLKSHCRV
jgi:hypothetical protein